MKVQSKIWIAVDVAKLLPSPDPVPDGYSEPEWTYGHEQRHVKNGIALAWEALRKLVKETDHCRWTHVGGNSKKLKQLTRLRCEGCVLKAQVKVAEWLKKQWEKEVGHILNPIPADAIVYPPIGSMPNHPS